MKTEFVKISPNAGGIKLEIESGAFGQPWTIQTYFISFIQERDIKMKHGFVVLKLKRHRQEENKAYKLIDRMNEVERANRADISENSAWSDEEKNGIIKIRQSAWEVNGEINQHLKVNIELEALETGISEEGFLTYE